MNQRKQSKFSKFYVKHIIKKPFVFYGFLGFGIGLFLYLSLTVKLDVVQSVPAEVSGHQITLKGEHDLTTGVMYLYYDRNDRVYKLQAVRCTYEDGNTVCTVEDNQGLSGKMDADLVLGSETLLKRIFVKAGNEYGATKDELCYSVRLFVEGCVQV